MRVGVVVLMVFATLVGCREERRDVSTTAGPVQRVPRHGDEIMVAGQMFRIGAPVVLWTDPGGYDAYRVEKRFAPHGESSWAATTQQSSAIETPNRYGLRDSVLSPDEIERVRGGGWDLDLLREKVDQFVIHYDACGTSRECFRVLHDQRGLSVHFMLDLDGTIYQTLDLKERAWHAGEANSRSIGIEIANVGAHPPEASGELDEWYQDDGTGRKRIVLPLTLGDGGIRTPGFVGYPIRDEAVVGDVQGKTLRQYDLTPEQYESLIKLTAALCTIFPRIACDYPRDADGNVRADVMPVEEWQSYQGLIGHYHISAAKVDPGPAFDWDRVVEGARRLMADTREP